jgi:hypothetical protein
MPEGVCNTRDLAFLLAWTNTQVLENGILGHWDLSLANFREPDFRDLAAKSAPAAVFACLDGMYSEDDASATLEFREEVE